MTRLCLRYHRGTTLVTISIEDTKAYLLRQTFRSTDNFVDIFGISNLINGDSIKDEMDDRRFDAVRDLTKLHIEVRTVGRQSTARKPPRDHHHQPRSRESSLGFLSPCVSSSRTLYNAPSEHTTPAFGLF